VLDVVRATELNDHLLMRGLAALLRADMCWQHREIAEAAVIQLYIALVVSDGFAAPTRAGHAESHRARRRSLA
jgi:hypothetical protein